MTDTVLNKEMRFKVRSECKNSNATNHSQWVETSVPPKGNAEQQGLRLACIPWVRRWSFICAVGIKYHRNRSEQNTSERDTRVKGRSVGRA